MALADLLADGHHDPLPADHRAAAERTGHGHGDPGRGEVGRLAQLDPAAVIRRSSACDRLPGSNSDSRSCSERSIRSRSDRTCQRSCASSRLVGGRGARVFRTSSRSWRKRTSRSLAVGARLASRRSSRLGRLDGLLDLSGAKVGVEGKVGRQEADQDQHDQPDPFLAVVGAMSHADRRARAHQDAADPVRAAARRRRAGCSSRGSLASRLTIRSRAGRQRETRSRARSESDAITSMPCPS